MFEALALDRFEIPPPPALPPMVVERVIESPAAQHQARTGERLLRRGRDMFDYWRRQIDEARSALETVEGVWTGTTDELAQAAINQMEEWAEDLARGIARIEKQSKRDIKRQYAIDPSMGAVTKRFVEELVELERQKIEEMLSWALFLRSSIAERSPNIGRSEMYSTPEAFLQAMSTAA